MKDSNGVRVGAVVLLNDLREIRELNERARRAEHLASIGRMAATVAHEIRNPLSSIRGLAQYFAGNSKGRDPEEKTYAQTIVSESDRLNTVVSELLDYARPLELNLEETSIEALFDDTIRTVNEKSIDQIMTVTQETQLPGIESELSLFDDAYRLNRHSPVISEMLEELRLRARAGDPRDGKTLTGFFESVPYGWDPILVRIVLAAMFRAGIISLKYEGRVYHDYKVSRARELLIKAINKPRLCMLCQKKEKDICL